MNALLGAIISVWGNCFKYNQAIHNIYFSWSHLGLKDQIGIINNLVNASIRMLTKIAPQSLIL
jgi:hypothetical protein